MNNTTKALNAARKAVNAETFGTSAWEARMQIVRDLCSQIEASAPVFEYTSDSGFHNYHLVNGKTPRKINVAEAR